SLPYTRHTRAARARHRLAVRLPGLRQPPRRSRLGGDPGWRGHRPGRGDRDPRWGARGRPQRAWPQYRRVRSDVRGRAKSKRVIRNLFRNVRMSVMEPYRSRTPDDKARASVAKEFFVYMITKDIQLEDCILDLIDNSIDGARRVLQRSSKDGQKADSPPDQNASLSDFKVALNLSSDRFVIEDNCGGITLADAKDYAFHFGRRPGTSK